MAYLPSMWSTILDLVCILDLHPVRPARTGTGGRVLAQDNSARHPRGQRVVPLTPKANLIQCAAQQAWLRTIYHCVVCGAALCGRCAFNSRGGRGCCSPGAAPRPRAFLAQLG